MIKVIDLCQQIEDEFKHSLALYRQISMYTYGVRLLYSLLDYVKDPVIVHTIECQLDSISMYCDNDKSGTRALDRIRDIRQIIRS